MRHPTTAVNTGTETARTAIVLTGLPAAGVSTVADVFASAGVPVYDTASAGDTPLRNWLPEQTGTVCIDGVTDRDTVESIRTLCASCLVIRVRAPDTSERLTRYLERELGDDRTRADENRVKNEFFDAQDDAEPLPPHDVVLGNESFVSMGDLIHRAEHIRDAVS